ncbi:ImcF-related family protein [Burkholderia sp. 22PA0106]|uniref:ImcF-related family protein n=1 Tax=Burkholderia sp. 22PA0106 TaxID=3237371 RepID=UPI0039C1CB7A
MLRKFRIDTLSIVIAFFLSGLTIWFKGDALIGLHSPEQRAECIVVLCCVLVLLYLWLGFDASSRPAIAMRRVRHWLKNQFGSSSEQSDGTAPAAQQSRAAGLRDKLRARHGWRWRFRDRWVLVAGDASQVERLAPGLVEAGYCITGNTVLLYARQTRDTLEIEWLDQIRRLRRRRRPVDAIVAVASHRSSSNAPFDADELAHRLSRHARALRWAAPVYLLNVTDFNGEVSSFDESIGFTWANARVSADDIDTSLQNLVYTLSDAGVARLAKNARDRYPAELSQHVSNLRGALSSLVLQTAQSRIWRHAVHGLLFVPLSKEPTSQTPADLQHRAIWRTVAEHSRGIRGRHVGLSLSVTAAWLVTALVGCWIAGAMVSGFINRASIRGASEQVAALAAAEDRTRAMQALDGLDRQIETLEIHRRDGASWSARFGLNRDGVLLDALWPHYAGAASHILVAPIQQQLEESLRQLASRSDAEIAGSGNARLQAAYDTLKAYLMLAKPERADSAFLTQQLVATAAPSRLNPAPLRPGAWEDLRQHTIAFLTDHWSQGRVAAMSPDLALVAATRQTIIGVRGIQNSTDRVYQQLLDDATAKYPPVSLAMLLGDSSSRGLFNTTVTVPGVFTRAAWDERISKAIDKAGEQHDAAGDWVLSDAKATQAAPSTLKAELRQRYFDDYALAWAVFLNGLRWQPARTLSDTADQLTLLGDPQRSPLVALMNAVVYQAGAGMQVQSLSNTLISKAQQLVGPTEHDPSRQPSAPLPPLAAAFGPILRLTGSDLGSGVSAGSKTSAPLAATGDLSLARYLERVTAVRLKVSQIASNADPDAMARVAAQSVLQGRTSDLGDSRDYASRVAASLGDQWAGFGELFRAPFDQAWQVVVQPAASNLNEIWRTAILADWNGTFGGRYPFADSDNDASLPDMARFMRPDNGVVTQFVATQLAGVVERRGDRWVAAQGADHGALTVDPAFLAGLNKLMRLSIALFPSGDAHMRYDLQAVPIPGVTDLKLVLSGRELHYFNQKQEWTSFEWPGQSIENRSHIEWQTAHGGLRTALDSQGRFGLIRLLEQAKVSKQDNARYLLTWMPDTSQGVPLKMQLRSEAGAGPLDVLELRHFTLPTRVFMTSAAPKRASFHPLPAAANPAAEQGGMSEIE